MGDDVLKCPFPWFGGKRREAERIWAALGAEVPNFIEPFAGSLATLLGRPGGAGKIETVNDIDRYLANFWRAIKTDPWSVAAWCDDPINEADLHARHYWLINQVEFRERMHQDPDFFDPKIAGWWAWGINAWIGAGWCIVPKRQMPDLAVTTRNGIATGRGVHATANWRNPTHQKLPHLAVKSDGAVAERGVHSAANWRTLPHLSSEQGVHLPSLGNDRGVHGLSAQPGTFLYALKLLESPEAPPCFEWFRQLALRLRRVRVACGDFERVLGRSILGKGKNVGGRRPCAVLLDPPYLEELRARGLYSEEDEQVSARARNWALANGNDPDLRIALCGLEGEHEMPKDWPVYAWKGVRGYSKEENQNRTKERIWFSPHCLKPERQPTLFDRLEKP